MAPTHEMKLGNVVVAGVVAAAAILMIVRAAEGDGATAVLAWALGAALVGSFVSIPLWALGARIQESPRSRLWEIAVIAVLVGTVPFLRAMLDGAAEAAFWAFLGAALIALFLRAGRYRAQRERI